MLIIAVVVVWHTTSAYLGGSSWYYMDRTTSKIWTTAFFPAYAISVYALGPLFLVAGWFSARSLAHKIMHGRPARADPRVVADPGAGEPGCHLTTVSTR